MLKKFKNFYLISLSVCLLLCGLLCFHIAKPVSVFAETINSASYFSATANNVSYTNGQTVFLNGSQTLKVTFGAPIGEAYTSNIYISENDIGEFALSDIESRFSLSINGVNMNTEQYKLLNLFSVNTFIFAPQYAQDNQTTKISEYKYFEMNIDLKNTMYFPTGEYVFTFYDYLEHSGADFANVKTQTFSATLYIFNTTDYFATDSAQNAKITIDNTRLIAPASTTYKNYYFFNYTNFNNGSREANFLPVLKFDANKFEIDITKTYQGISQNLKVSYYAENFVVLGNQSEKFVDVSYNRTTGQLEVLFSDIGDYSIKYNFIYPKNNGAQIIPLNNPLLNDFKQDILYLFGYQLYYFDMNSQQKEEFKQISSAKAGGELSADVSYLAGFESLTSENLDDVKNDTTILNAVSAKTPASTNQPSISVLYNADLISKDIATGELISYYYKLDQATGDWLKDASDEYVKFPYQNDSIADTGTYLLKVVYNYSNNFNSSGNRATGQYFTQYFYFEITNSYASVSIKELVPNENGSAFIEENLSSDEFTQNGVKVYLSAQSVFNSDVRVVIEGKQHGARNYSPIKTLYGTDKQQSYQIGNSASENLNYRVTKYFGNEKPQVSYFTIDNTSFKNVKILNVSNSVSSSKYFVKGSEVDFFTNSAVTVQWDEKASGAPSTAYYKFIPFKSTSLTTPNELQFSIDNAIPTNYALDFNLSDNLAEARYYNSKELTLLTQNYTFSEQGLYIIKLSDSAGNWQYVSFVIDKTEISVWQLSHAGGASTYQSVQKYNVVSADTTLQWGLKKLIKINLNTTQIDNIADQWFKDVILDKEENSNDVIVSSYNSGEFYFAPEISSVAYVQEGTTYYKLNNKNSFDISLIKNVEGFEIVNEITYVIYLIDESNPLFKEANSLSREDFANHASKNYRITVSTDASGADVVFNSSNSTSNDYSNLNYTSTNLSQAGYTDSYSYDNEYLQYNDEIDTRSKYFYSTGTTINGNVSLLTYIFITTPSENVKVENVTVYFYPFVKENGHYKLNNLAISTVIYDLSDSIDLTTAISTGDFTGFNAYNINPEFITNSGYQTADGKYVIVRTYTQASEGNVDKKYDFMIRENVFIVDRQNIVSTPETDGSNKSIIGQYIHVNVLDGYVGSKSFENLYMAYYQESELFKSNKLPVVNYVPISKYGYEDRTVFKFYDNLQYFYTMTADLTHYLLNRYETSAGAEKSILGASYFGQGTYTTNNFQFNQNLSYITNTSFDLSVSIEFANSINDERTVIYRNSANNSDGYYISTLFKNSGYYFVTLTQNYANGNTAPNVRNEFTYVFRIVTQAPNFDFIDSAGNTLETLQSTISGTTYDIAYTNDNTSVTISWTDPSDEYMAKINTNGVNGLSEGIYYWTSTNPTKQRINVGDGVNQTGDLVINGLKKSFSIDISHLESGTILYVYMEYEGDGKNNPNSNVTKALYIDKEAPLTVLNQLTLANSIDGVNIANLSRVYLDENNNISLTEKQFNAPRTTTALAYYSFAVELTAENLTKFFSKQPAVHGFFTEGYNYYAKEQLSSDSLIISTINSAKNAFATHTNNISLQDLKVNTYYEIIEEDLAGNLTIYLIYFTAPMQDNENVLTFEKPETDFDKTNALKYNDLSVSGTNIYAKGSFHATNINLYNFPWQLIKVNNITYLSSPELNRGEFYDVSNWINIEDKPLVYSIEEILSFNASRSIQNLIIVDSAKNLKFPVRISVTDEVLNYSATTEFEGLRISGVSYQGGIGIWLENMEVYSWEGSRYVKIFEGNKNDGFNSNGNLTFTQDGSTFDYTIQINQPKIAYKYVFADNFGVNYVFYHTCGEPVIEDNLLGEVKTITTLNDDGASEIWSVGLDDLTYYYSNVDYYVYMNIYFLAYDAQTDAFSWQIYSPETAENQYGHLVSNGISTAYYECKTSKISSSINVISLFAQDKISGLDLFSGSAIKFVITLVNVNESPSVSLDINNVHQERILINNLIPDIKLYDKNNQDKTTELFNGEKIFSGQLTIRFGDLEYDNDFVFPVRVTIQHENNAENIISTGTIVSEAGSYIVRTYVEINGEFIKIKTQGFIISESSNQFFNVMVYNQTEGIWEIKNTTGEVFEYNGNNYTFHYLVNTEQYRISTNEEQDIEATELPYSLTTGGTTTKFYKISNYGTLSQSVNFYEKTIAITFVKTENLISSNSFYYTSADGGQIQLSGISSQVVITTDNQDFDTLTIVYNSYFGISANKIDIKVYQNETGKEYMPEKHKINNNLNSITLSQSGTYTIEFSDKAGNKHTFIDNTYGYNSKSYTLTYINGVAFLINDANPIENGIYNDSVSITLPKNLDSMYDIGGKPSINVLRNGTDYTASVKKENGAYIIDKAGYYTVSFSAIINANNVRKQEYNFTILSSHEGRWSFEYSQFENYEITEIKRNDKVLDLSNYFEYNQYVIQNGQTQQSVKYLTNVLISVYDELTGAGEYEITIRTNVGTLNEAFTFKFVIKDTNDVPLKISIEEGQKTTDAINISFNAYTLFANLGECQVRFDNTHFLNITEEYINSLTDYNVNMQITQTGTYFVQVVTESGKVLYSYKVIKQEPLNAGSIIIIVVSVVGGVGLIVVIILLRKKMKVK